MISYVSQLVLTLLIIFFYPLVIEVRTINDPLPRRIRRWAGWLLPEDHGLHPVTGRLIFTNFYDTSITVTTSLLIASVASSTERAGLYQLTYLGFISEITAASLMVAYTLVGVHSRHPRARLVASFPALALFGVAQAMSKIASKDLVFHTVLPFFDTLGSDCSGTSSRLAELKDAVYPRESHHQFTLISFAIFIIYFIDCALHLAQFRSSRSKPKHQIL